MKLLPHDRYGQFCSANALVRSCILIIGGIGCGLFLDCMKPFGTTPDSCYRFISIWNEFFALGYLGFLYLLYRQWLVLGGLNAYVPPTNRFKPDRFLNASTSSPL